MLDVRSGQGDAANFATRFVKRLAPRSTPSSKPAGSVTIGRATDNDIVIPDVLASRYHATLTLTPLGTEIRDTSVNGTFVNGTRVGSAILSDGDVVTIGNIDLTDRVSAGEVPPRVFLSRLERQGNPLTVHVDVEHLDGDLVTDLDHLGRVVECASRTARRRAPDRPPRPGRRMRRS